MSTSKQSGKGPALDDILGRARNALNRSQQFRASNPQLLGTTGNKTTQPKPQAKNKTAPVHNLGTKVPLRQPGTKSPGKKTLVSKHLKSNISSSSDEDIRLMLNQPLDTTSHDSDASDSTITPPTITDTSAKDKRHAKLSKRDKHHHHLPKHEAPKNSPRPEVKTKDLVEKTILARGDRMSQETYKVIKSMQTSSPNTGSIMKKSPRTSLLEELYLPHEEDTYTEDFISEIRTASDASIEVPKTESTVERPDDFDDRHDEDSINSHLRSTSMSLVEEIRENLQNLEVSDKPKSSLSEEDEDIQNAFTVGDLPPSDEYGEGKNKSIKDLRQPRHTQQGDSQSINDRSSIAGSTSSTLRSKSVYSTRVSYNSEGKAPVSNKSSKQSVSKHSDKSDQSGAFSTSSMASRSRLSETQSFQRALAKVHLDEEEHPHDHTNGNFSPTAIPLKTKPQIKIHQILKQEVYVKELKRLRDLHKKEEKLMKKLNVVKAENYMKSKASEAGVKNYLQPNYTKILKTSSKLSQSPPSDALVLHPDFTGHLPPPENLTADQFKEQVSKMDIQHLVTEVVASNERMYNMTIAAANDMAKQYGKDTKLLMKIKRKREERQKH